MPYLLDTDMVSALQHGHRAVVARITATSPADLFVSIVTYEEQVAGRLHVLRGQLSADRLVEAYERLQQTLAFFATITLLPFDWAAARRDEEFRLRYRRMGTKDRRIAAIAAVNRCTLVTRNTVDFRNIGELSLENWIDQQG